jgi:hypothetical protein
MIRIRVKPGRLDERRSLRGEHLRARAEANPAQELYLVVDDAADADLVYLFEFYGDPAKMQRNTAAQFAGYMAGWARCWPSRHWWRRERRRGRNAPI